MPRPGSLAAAHHRFLRETDPSPHSKGQIRVSVGTSKARPASDPFGRRCARAIASTAGIPVRFGARLLRAVGFRSVTGAISRLIDLVEGGH